MIFGSDGSRLGDDRMRALHIYESHRSIELEIQLQRIEQMKQGEVVFLEAQMLQRVL